MQTDFRYFASFKIVLVLFILGFLELKSKPPRNPFCFADTSSKVPFSYTATAKVHNCSKSFAILSYFENSRDHQKVIAKKGDTVLGYKIIDIFDDALTVQDDKNNEMILDLK